MKLFRTAFVVASIVLTARAEAKPTRAPLALTVDGRERAELVETQNWQRPFMCDQVVSIVRDGNTLWSATLNHSGPLGGTESKLFLMDLDGDGRFELVTVSQLSDDAGHYPPNREVYRFGDGHYASAPELVASLGNRPLPVSALRWNGGIVVEHHRRAKR